MYKKQTHDKITWTNRITHILAMDRVTVIGLKCAGKTAKIEFRPKRLPRFVKIPDDRFNCRKCCRILLPPVLQSDCGHRFCSQCTEIIFKERISINCPCNEKECVAISQQTVIYLIFFLNHTTDSAVMSNHSIWYLYRHWCFLY